MAKRAVVFVCVGLMDHSLVVKNIIAQSAKEAKATFFDQTKTVAQEVMGPFYRKRAVYETERQMKFSNQTVKAEYDGWRVNACLLKEPENHAFLIFTGRIDGKKMASPKTTTVSVSDLRFL